MSSESEPPLCRPRPGPLSPHGLGQRGHLDAGVGTVVQFGRRREAHRAFLRNEPIWPPSSENAEHHDCQGDYLSVTAAGGSGRLCERSHCLPSFGGTPPRRTGPLPPRPGAFPGPPAKPGQTNSGLVRVKQARASARTTSRWLRQIAAPVTRRNRRSLPTALRH